MAKGTVIRDQHFPGRAPIDAYGNGGFRFADMSHRGSILCLPSGIYGWAVRETAEFGPEAFERVIRDAAEVEVLLVGTGKNLVPLRRELRELFRQHTISSDSMSTGAAIRTYNIMLAENRAVAAAFLAVE